MSTVHEHWYAFGFSSWYQTANLPITGPAIILTFVCRLYKHGMHWLSMKHLFYLPLSTFHYDFVYTRHGPQYAVPKYYKNALSIIITKWNSNVELFDTFKAMSETGSLVCTLCVMGDKSPTEPDTCPRYASGNAWLQRNIKETRSGKFPEQTGLKIILWNRNYSQCQI